jgi:hypothetical protein
MLTSSQVRDRVRLEPGRNVETIETDPYDDQIHVTSDINATAKNGIVILFFSFSKEGVIQDKLY